MSNDTDSFVQEVDEGLRQERMLVYAKRFGPWLGGLLVALILGLGGWQVWRDQTTQAARRQADAFVAAQELVASGNLDDAKAAFEQLSNEGPATYRVMARMQRAAVLEGQGDLQAALAGFDEAAEAARDPLMKATAQLRAAYIVADTQDFAALQSRLQPLIDAGGQTGVLARELLGVEAWESGQTELARSSLEAVNLAFDAPESVRQRAQLVLALLGPAPEAAAENNNDAPAQAPAQGEAE